MTLSKPPDGVHWLIWALVAIAVACISAYGTIKASDSSKREPSPSPSTSITELGKDNKKRCIGIAMHSFSLNLFTQQPPVGVAAITSVLPNKPAALAGLQPGDLIFEVNGQSVTNAQDVTNAVTETNKVLYMKLYRPQSYNFGSNGISVYPPYQQLNYQLLVTSECGL